MIKRLDPIYIKAMAGLWEEAIKDAQQLPYYDQSLETDLGVMRSVFQRVKDPKEDVPVRVVARRRTYTSNLDIASEVWGVDEEYSEEEDIEDYYYMGFDIYGIYPDDVEEKGINLLAALYYDERINPNPDKEEVDEINRMIEENREVVEIYRKLRKEGRGPVEARREALEEMYRRRYDQDGIEELPF